MRSGHKGAARAADMEACASETSYRRPWLITGVSRGLSLALAQAALARGDTVVGTVRAGTPRPVVPGPGALHLLTWTWPTRSSSPSVVDQAFALAGTMQDVIVNNAGYGLLERDRDGGRRRGRPPVRSRLLPRRSA